MKYDMNFIALDLETSGLSPVKDQIIEIGAIRYIAGKQVEEFSTLVRNELPLREKIVNITGIKDDMLADAPEWQQAMRDFLEFAGDEVILGHGIEFDYSFLKTAAYKLSVDYRVQGLDTLRMCRHYHSDLESRRLGDMCNYYGIINPQAHRAVADAQTAAALYMCLVEEFGDIDTGVLLSKPLEYTVKKTEPPTAKQKKYLIDLINYHRIDMIIDWETLTKSDVSRKIDRIILEYGNPKYSKN